MSQSAELEKVKTLIRGLSEKTTNRGCSSAEAESAMQKVGELLERYDLTMDEVSMHQEKFVTITIDTGAKRKSAMQSVVVRLAEFCGCKAWQWMTKDSITYKFFGMEPDVEMVQYLYDVINSALVTETEIFKLMTPRQDRGQKKIASTNFQYGFAAKISSRLRLLRDEHEAHLASLRQTGTALMIIKGTLVEQAYQKHTADLKLRQHKQYYSRQQNYDARSAGFNAAEKVNLSRPLGSESRNKLMLK